MEQNETKNHLRKSIKGSFNGIVIGYSQLFATRFFGRFQRLRGGVEVTSSVTFDKDKVYLFIANHQSRIDPFVAFASLSFAEDSILKPARFLTASGLYYSFLRPLLKLLGCYPTRRKNWDSVSQSAEFLRRGYNVMIFPEGRRTLRSESDPRPGVERILASAPAFTIPVLIHIEWEKRGGTSKHAVVHMRESSMGELLSLPASEIMDLVYKV
jgi:1-acyl-sn-glycerol-3-phosphate acyltransferase